VWVLTKLNSIGERKVDSEMKENIKSSKNVIEMDNLLKQNV